MQPAFNHCGKTLRDIGTTFRQSAGRKVDRDVFSWVKLAPSPRAIRLPELDRCAIKTKSAKSADPATGCAMCWLSSPMTLRGGVLRSSVSIACPRHCHPRLAAICFRLVRVAGFTWALSHWCKAVQPCRRSRPVRLWMLEDRTPAISASGEPMRGRAPGGAARAFRHGQGGFAMRSRSSGHGQQSPHRVLLAFSSPLASTDAFSMRYFRLSMQA